MNDSVFDYSQNIVNWDIKQRSFQDDNDTFLHNIKTIVFQFSPYFLNSP